MSLLALAGADVFDGERLHRRASVLLEGRILRRIVVDIPAEAQIVEVPDGILMPGFVDLQVNGGGGVLLNDAPTVETLATIAAAHAATGTRAFLPTLITDTPKQTEAAIDAVTEAVATGIPCVAGLHLEGPHLSQAKKGAHDGGFIRPMRDADVDLLCVAAQRLPNLMVTLAPENASPEQIQQLVKAGGIVSLGHSDCSAEQAKTAFDAGATCVTHLFNAMSQLDSRAPGLVGATMAAQDIRAGLIADGIHVHPDSLRVAISAMGRERLCLVTDAMATVGSGISEFVLNGRRVLRRDGRLTLEDGTLAGADLTMPQAVRTMVETVGVPLVHALQMATSVPAKVLRNPGGAGRLVPGQNWSGIHLSRDFDVSDPLLL